MMNYFSKALPLFAPFKSSSKFVAPLTLKNFEDIFLCRSAGKVKHYFSDTVETEEFIVRGAIRRIIEDR